MASSSTVQQSCSGSSMDVLPFPEPSSTGMTREYATFLWNQFFFDPSQFSDYRAIKKRSSSPDFRHKKTRAPLWLNASFNPPWVEKEVRRLGLEQGIFHSQRSHCMHVVDGESSKDRSFLLNLVRESRCRKDGEVEKARSIHARIIEKSSSSFFSDVYLCNILLSLYIKCGALVEAQQLFNKLPCCDVASWNVLISGYMHYGLNAQALHCFWHMQAAGFSPDAVTFVCILKVCSDIGSLGMIEEINAEVSKRRLFQKNIVLGTTMVRIYAKHGMLEKSKEVFDKLPVQSTTTWNALISGYAQHGLGHEALKCFRQMQDEGFYPDAVTFICALRACSIIGSLEMGKEVHAQMNKYGIFEKHVMLGTILVDMYGKCGDLVKAQELFDELPSRNVRTWNVLIAGYVQHGYFENALKCFRQMKEEKGVYPNAATFSCILKACGSLWTLEMGKEIHEEIAEKNLLKDNVVLGTALVDMYAKCGSLERAQEVFQELPQENIIAWNAMIAGYAKHGFGDKALEYFRKMQSMGLQPDAVTFICILKVCSSIGALKVGEEIHADVSKKESLCKDVVLGTALVNMYVKCGMQEKALEVFTNLPLWNVVSWNVLLAGYAQLGQATMVWMLFNKMLAQGVMPNLVTFLVLLITCNHAGLVEEGQRVFDAMCWVYQLSPEIEHYSCMADLLGRAGQFENTILTIEKVQHYDRLPLWVAFLGACCTAVNMELGMWAFERCVQLDEKCTAAYVYMGNLYATASMRTK